MKRLLAIAIAPLLVAIPAWAQDGGSRFCPNRPDLGSGACTTDPGRLLVELSGIDWQRDETATEREDTFVAGDMLLRTGLGPSTELQFSWTIAGRVRTRDKASGAVDVVTGTGDIRVGLRQNLRNPDVSGFAIAVEPYVMLPVGREPIGAGDWSAGLVLPVSYELADKLDLSFTGTLAAAVDEDADGRHFQGNGTLGLGYALTDTVSAVAEVSVTRDDDPAEAITQVATALSFAWQPQPNRQLDILAVAGLNRPTPDFRLVLGGAFLF